MTIGKSLLRATISLPCARGADTSEQSATAAVVKPHTSTSATSRTWIRVLKTAICGQIKGLIGVHHDDIGY